ncbi:hepatic sodium/bile acid cotransporter-like [Oppia nitens]|uniref:hepatic sodium/bile acid cotransporter-like n=1 Tax=Oppia nitens TaxID=1686743 RepID=UPI0023D98B5A|nr:hepatic sodium/bile acid cotransporter-like [Oppia nitens]XP_054165382.1 hepatic sodium/bile acid cotransporter-like [Oppia nitens]
MCPVVLLALILSVILLLLEVTAALSVTFRPSQVKQLKEDQLIDVSFNLNTSINKFNTRNNYYEIYIDDQSIVEVVGNKTLNLDNNLHQNYTFELRGKSLGHSWLEVVNKNNTDDRSERLAISVIRPSSRLTKIFTICVAVLISINYINMGCALDLNVVLQVIKRPIAPIIGFVCQYGFMPLMAYIVGKVLLRESYLQLGLFVFGASPGGGASNMWTVLCGGNLNLSITMTFISTLSAIFMMPLWLFTLGRNIFEGTTTTVPLHNIFGSLASMTIFLGVGLLFQRFIPRVANICRKILAPVSIAMIIFIVIFGTYANLYMFRLMSWRILLSASINVWSGFLIGLLASILLKQSSVNQIAIAIETGIQNTGVAIVLLGLSLPQPDADLASVIPVAASVMTPIPLTIVYIIIKVKNCLNKESKVNLNSGALDDSIVNECLNPNKTISSTLPLNGDNKNLQKYTYDQINWTNGNI